MSIYNPKHNALFIHVPKTAGTSMERAPFLGGGGHETIRDYPNVPESAFRFSFVRNPWDRLVSGFACQHAYEGAGPDRFREFVYSHCSDGEYPTEGVYTNHFLPQWHFLLDNHDNIGVDYIGRFESLDSDWRHVCDILNVKYELPHYRKGERGYYKDYYTADTWDIVGKLYQRDVDLFGYGKDVFTRVKATAH